VSFVSPVSIARYTDILADAAIPARDLNAASRNVAFNAMDKTVHRRPGYAFALARSSQRISKYEYMLGENLMPWFQGDGAHYLYLSGQDQTSAYGVDYYTTVSPYRLAGVTAPVEARRSVPELYGTQWYDNPARGFTSSSESQNHYVYFPVGTNKWSGGVALDPYGVAGLVLSSDFAWAAKQAGELPDDFVAYRNADATKSWFMFDDEIVVLAAGVSGGAGRAVTTTLDSRIAAVTDPVAVTRSGSWARWTNGSQAVGYLFLDGQEAVVSLTEVTASRRMVRQTNPDTRVTKKVFTVARDDASNLAYALVPNATEAQLESYVDGRLSVLANSTEIQAVKHTGLGIVAANVFGHGTHHAERLAIGGPASVLLRSVDGVTSVAVSDPTMERDSISVTVHGRRMGVVSADEGVRVTAVNGGTRIDVTTRHAYGRSFTATLR
jgi:hyaluronate lyase